MIMTVVISGGLLFPCVQEEHSGDCVSCEQIQTARQLIEQGRLTDATEKVAEKVLREDGESFLLIAYAWFNSLVEINPLLYKEVCKDENSYLDFIDEVCFLGECIFDVLKNQDRQIALGLAQDIFFKFYNKGTFADLASAYNAIQMMIESGLTFQESDYLSSFLQNIVSHFNQYKYEFVKNDKKLLLLFFSDLALIHEFMEEVVWIEGFVDYAKKMINEIITSENVEKFKELFNQHYDDIREELEDILSQEDHEELFAGDKEDFIDYCLLANKFIAKKIVFKIVQEMAEQETLESFKNADNYIKATFEKLDTMMA